MAVSEDKVTLFFIVVLISVILLANSFGVLSPLEHGFVQRWPSNQLDRTRVYKSGRYFLGLGNYFVKFPATARRLDFTASGRSQISAATKDQLSVGIDMTVYYKLKNTANGALLVISISCGVKYDRARDGLPPFLQPCALTNASLLSCRRAYRTIRLERT